jgi:hypothetical protein
VIRFLLFRFLPARLVPILTILELVWVVRRWRHRNDPSQTAMPATPARPTWDPPA